MRAYASGSGTDKDGNHISLTFFTWDTCFLKEDPECPNSPNKYRQEHIERTKRLQSKYARGEFSDGPSLFRLQVCGCPECRQFYIDNNGN